MTSKDDTTLITSEIGAKLLMIERNEFAALERKGWFKPAAQSPARYRIVELVQGYIKAQKHEQERGRTGGECAAHLGIGRRRFIELLDQGVITRANSKGYNFDQVRHEYHEHLRKVASARGEDTGAASLSQTRARLANAKAEQAEFEGTPGRAEIGYRFGW